MFSLRTNKSMRLQKYGAWIAYHDTQSDSVFWYNHETAQVRQGMKIVLSDVLYSCIEWRPGVGLVGCVALHKNRALTYIILL
jgi:hypothetical protein